MSPLFWVTYGLQWLIIAVLVVLVMLLYRQFGLMIMPGGRRVSYGGLNLGARAPAVIVQLDGDRDLAFDWSPLSSTGVVKATFALFALPTCPLCALLAQDHEGMVMLSQRYPSVQFLWVQEEEEAGHEIPLPPNWILARSSHSAAHDAMEVPGSPFAYFIATSGHIMAKGLVNRTSDIDAMIASAPAGVVAAAEPVAS